MDERFEEWIKGLLSDNDVNSVDELSPEMVIEAIRDTKNDINNQENWEAGSSGIASACHRNNAEDLRDYILFLETLVKGTHTLELILGVYEDPDELPKRVVFLVPDTVDLDCLKENLIVTRDKLMEAFPDECVEDLFELVLDKACYCWRYEALENLHGKENLWAMQLSGGES
jgi:hypothetical protein